MTGNHIEYGKIGTYGLWKVKVSGSRRLKGKNLRKQHCRCQTSCKQRINGKLPDCCKQAFPSIPPFQNQKSPKIDNHKNTDHNGNIVIGKDGHSQGNTVQKTFLLFYQALQPQHYDWEQHDAVQPHNVPAISGHITGQGIKNSKKGGSEIPGVAVSAQIPGHRKTCKSRL